MHTEARDFVLGILNSHLDTTFTYVVELGSRDINGSARQFVTCLEYTGVDLHPGPGVDVVCDAATYVPPQAPDLVICMETLEHAPNAREIVLNIGRMLVLGGHAIITCATDPRPPHAATGIQTDGTFAPLPGEYYANIDPEALYSWAREAGLRVMVYQTRRDCGDTYLYAVRTRGFEPLTPTV